MKARFHMNYETADRVLAGLTARQVCVVGTAGVAAWGAFVTGSRAVGAIGAAALCIPVVVVGGVLATHGPDGSPMDAFALNALRHIFSGKRRVLAPYGSGVSERRCFRNRTVLQVPLRAVTNDGFIDLGSSGAAAVVKASGVNFRLRSEAERRALATAFGALMHSLDRAVQFLVTARPVDADALVSRIEEAAPFLPHPRLTDAARQYTHFFSDLVRDEAVLRHETFICLRDPKGGPAAASDLRRRVMNLDELAREVGVRLERLEADCLLLVASMVDPPCPRTPEATR